MVDEVRQSIQMTIYLQAQAAQIRPLLFVIVLAVGLGCPFQFYSNSVVNNLFTVVQPFYNDSFYQHYGYWLDKENFDLLWSVTTASLQIGATVGSVATQILAERVGRRIGLIITSTVCIIGSILTTIPLVTNSFELLIFGRLILGLSLGCSLGLASMFINEISPSSFRGMFGSLLQVCLGLGNLLSLIFTLPQLFGTESLWPISMIIPAITSLIQLVVLLLSHETPPYLIYTIKNAEKATRSLSFYGGNAFHLTMITKVLSAKKSTVKELFKQNNLRLAIILSIIIAFAVQFSGIAAILAYSKTMFVNAGFDDLKSKYASLGIGVCNTLSPLISTLLVERLGRKSILIGGLSICLSCLCSLILFNELNINFNWQPGQILTLPCLYIFQIGFSLSSSVLWIIAAELFPQAARSTAMTTIVFFFFLFQTIVVFAYLPLSVAAGTSLSFLPFIIALVISIFLLLKFLPETKGVKMDEVERQMFRRMSRISQISSISGGSFKL
ncbi:unnamed protein product [Soboliphyme baturini]|uniref:MFS domain-containing protein n=1 Tax=Soboliphyme baturini TaxID=241478 RepID=A0A183I9G2_9BILA|nr:unnamed protein product [Soboliphyme baturini]